MTLPNELTDLLALKQQAEYTVQELESDRMDIDANITEIQRLLVQIEQTLEKFERLSYMLNQAVKSEKGT